ncbi:MAG: hypothetical protein WD066_20570 [Planctomycetaceae bacterium]
MRIIPELVLHAIGAAGGIALLSGVPVILYAVAASISPDSGGPMNLVLVPLIAFTFATCITLCLNLPVAVLSDWLTRRRGWPRWPVLPAFVLFALAASWTWTATHPRFTSWETSVVVGTALGLLVGSGFALQWGTLIVGRSLISRLAPVSARDRAARDRAG